MTTESNEFGTWQSRESLWISTDDLTAMTQKAQDAVKEEREAKRLKFLKALAGFVVVILIYGAGVCAGASGDLFSWLGGLGLILFVSAGQVSHRAFGE